MTDSTNTIRRPVPAAGGVVFNDAGEVLLIQRGKEPRKGAWSVPGGKLDFGERVEDALTREVMEETGIQIEILGLLDVIDLVGPRNSDTGEASDIHYVLIDYLARAVGGTLQAGDDAADARFVPVETAIEMVDWDETARMIEDGAAILAEMHSDDDDGNSDAS